MTIYTDICIADLECVAMCLSDTDSLCLPSDFISNGPNTDVCLCDDQCLFFQDCCSELDALSDGCNDTQQAFSDTSVSLWSCQSLYPPTVNVSDFSPVQVGVYAVSKCPPSWVPLSRELGLSAMDTLLVQNVCSNGPSGFPLVSDAATGRVYRNDFCALCNSVSQLVFWENTVFCSQDLLEELRSQPSLTLDMLDQFCGSCSSQSPPSLYDRSTIAMQPRSCTPAISHCPSFTAFSALRSDSFVSSEDYQQIVNNCAQETSYIRAFSSIHEEEAVFKNTYCLTCNEPVAMPSCYEFDQSRFPLCNSTAINSSGVQVELTINAVTSTVDLPDPTVGNITLDHDECPFEQVFDFVTRSCRMVSCFRFPLPNSTFPCSLLGYSPVENTGEMCSQLVLLDNPLLVIPLNDTIYYYLPLRSVVFVRTNQEGLPVTCLDFAVPRELPLLRLIRAFNVLTFLVVSVSGVVLGFIIVVYTIPPQFRSIFGMVIASLATTSLLSDVTLIMGYPAVFKNGNIPLCYTAGILDRYFGLAQFYWINVHTFDVVLRFYHETNSIRRRSTLPVILSYVAVGWCVPAIITALEVGVVFISGNMGSFSSCFHVSSFWSGFFFYLFPGAIAIGMSLVVSVYIYVKAVQSPEGMDEKSKRWFITLFVLIGIMFVSLVVRGSTLDVPNRLSDYVIGFFRLLVTVTVFTYMAVVFVFTKKMRRVLCGCSKGTVQPVTVEEIEMATKKCDEEKAMFKTTVIEISPNVKLDKELEEFADQLERPWTCTKEEHPPKEE